jgi:hypothetical protein
MTTTKPYAPKPTLTVEVRPLARMVQMTFGLGDLCGRDQASLFYELVRSLDLADILGKAETTHPELMAEINAKLRIAWEDQRS